MDVVVERPALDGARVQNMDGGFGQFVRTGATLEMKAFTGVRLPAGMPATVTVEAGLATRWNALPAGIAHGVVLLAVHLFENRLADATPPAAIAALWRPFRRLGLGLGLESAVAG